MEKTGEALRHGGRTRGYIFWVCGVCLDVSKSTLLSKTSEDNARKGSLKLCFRFRCWWPPRGTLIEHPQITHMMCDISNMSRTLFFKQLHHLQGPEIRKKKTQAALIRASSLSVELVGGGRLDHLGSWSGDSHSRKETNGVLLERSRKKIMTVTGIYR